MQKGLASGLEGFGAPWIIASSPIFTRQNFLFFRIYTTCHSHSNQIGPMVEDQCTSCQGKPF